MRGELIGFAARCPISIDRASRFSSPPFARLAVHSTLAALAALLLSTRRRISVALVITLRRGIALRLALVPIAIAFAIAVLTLLAALLPTRTLRTTLVPIARHVSIPALLVSLIRLSHWFLLSRFVAARQGSKLDAELIRCSP